jgi:hypothetical protein
MSKDIYSTSDLSLAAFLIVRGIRLERLVKFAHRGEFEFARSAAVDNLVLGWMNRETYEVCPRHYLSVIKDLKCQIGEMADNAVLSYVEV